MTQFLQLDKLFDPKIEFDVGHHLQLERLFDSNIEFVGGRWRTRQDVADAVPPQRRTKGVSRVRKN